MKKLLIIMSLMSLLMVGCSEEKSKSATTEDTPAGTAPAATGEITVPAGVGEAVIPENGDIVIPLN